MNERARFKLEKAFPLIDEIEANFLRLRERSTALYNENREALAELDRLRIFEEDRREWREVAERNLEIIDAARSIVIEELHPVHRGVMAPEQLYMIGATLHAVLSGVAKIEDGRVTGSVRVFPDKAAAILRMAGIVSAESVLEPPVPPGDIEERLTKLKPNEMALTTFGNNAPDGCLQPGNCGGPNDPFCCSACASVAPPIRTDNPYLDTQPCPDCGGFCIGLDDCLKRQKGAAK